MGQRHSRHCRNQSEKSVTTTTTPSVPINNEMKQETRKSLFGENNYNAVGKYISSRLVSVATIFWLQNIYCLGIEEKLELGCSIFFSMLLANGQMRRLMKPDSTSNIKTMGLRYLEKLGWLLRTLANPNVNAYSLLAQLRSIHQKYGVKLKHFDIMIEALHETMSYYFPKQYNIDYLLLSTLCSVYPLYMYNIIQVQYAMEVIIALAARIMGVSAVDTNAKTSRIKAFQGANTVFLESLEACLSSEIGREYFYRYLHRRGCSELTVYLELIKKFKNQSSNKQRYVVAKDLMKECIYPNAEYAVNISYERRKALLDSFPTISQVSIDYFENVEMEIRRLIIKNHWNPFVRNVCQLHNSANIDHLLQ